MKNTYDILVIGELNVDLILNKIATFPEMGKEKIAEEMALVLGSSSAILASNLSSLGSSVGFLGVIGKDSFGELILKTLKEKGVDTSHIIQSNTHATGATVVMSFDNDRANVTYPGAMETLTLSDISDEVLGSARHLHFSSAFLQPGILQDLPKLFQRAKKLGLTTSLDPQWDPQEKWELNTKNILPHVDFFLPNEQELLALSKKDTVEEAIQQLNSPNTIIVKRGTRGATLFEPTNTTSYPAFLNENVVDTVGAGDSFNAGFLFKFLEGEAIEDCMTFGSLTGAVNTTAPGGTGAFINYETVLNIIKNKFGYKLKSHEVTR